MKTVKNEWKDVYEWRRESLPCWWSYAVIVSSGQKIWISKKKVLSKFGNSPATTGMLTETLLMSLIMTNHWMHWGPLKYPCTVNHPQLLRRAIFYLFSVPSSSHFSCFSFFSGVLILFHLPPFARPASRKTKICIQKNYLSAFGMPWEHCKTQRCLGDLHVNFTGRLTAANFPCTDWPSYLRTQLSMFVVCLQSKRFFLAPFSQIYFFAWKRYLNKL